MPGCWLKKGVNEIIVLDLKGPKEATIVGLNKPILDMLRVAVPETHRKQGQTIKLEKETPVSAGTFKPGNGWQEVKVPVTKGRYFCLEGCLLLIIPTLPPLRSLMCRMRRRENLS